LNKRATSAELVNFYVLGGGVIEGFALTYSGLDLTIAAGKLLALQAVDLPAKTVTVAPSVTRYVWIDSTGDVAYTATSASPGSAYACIGTFTSSGSAITSASTAGKQLPVVLYSGDRVADVLGGVKLDGDTETILIKHLRGNGAPIDRGFANITGAKANADYTLIAAEYECSIIRLGWTGWTGGHNVVIPSVTGATFEIINETGQAATIIAATGTGITIASNKTARVFFDGVNVRRLTADI
jgi:hypothetical protein